MYKGFKEADAGSVFLKVILCNLVVQVLFSVASTISMYAYSFDLSQNAAANYTAMFLLQAVNIGVVLLHLKKLKEGRAGFSAFFAPPRGRKNLAFAVAPIMSAAVIFGFFPIAQLFQTALGAIGFKGGASVPLSGPAQIAVGCIATILIAPLCEEAVFRGVMVPGLKTRNGDIAVILMSGLAFSVMHMNPEQTVLQFFLGCSAAYLMLRCGSVLPAMVLHSFNNVFAVLSETTAFGAAFESIASVMASNVGIAIAIALGAAVAGIAAVYGLGLILKGKGERLMLKRPPDPPAVPGDEQAALSYGVMGKATGKILYYVAVGLCAFLWICIFAIGIMSGLNPGAAV